MSRYAPQSGQTYFWGLEETISDSFSCVGVKHRLPKGLSFFLGGGAQLHHRPWWDQWRWNSGSRHQRIWRCRSGFLGQWGQRALHWSAIRPTIQPRKEGTEGMAWKHGWGDVASISRGDRRKFCQRSSPTRAQGAIKSPLIGFFSEWSIKYFVFWSISSDLALSLLSLCLNVAMHCFPCLHGFPPNIYGQDWKYIHTQNTNTKKCAMFIQTYDTIVQANAHIEVFFLGNIHCVTCWGNKAHIMEKGRLHGNVTDKKKCNNHASGRRVMRLISKSSQLFLYFSSIWR